MLEPAGTRGYDDLRHRATREPIGEGLRPPSPTPATSSACSKRSAASTTAHDRDDATRHRTRPRAQLGAVSAARPPSDIESCACRLRLVEAWDELRRRRHAYTRSIGRPDHPERRRPASSSSITSSCRSAFTSSASSDLRAERPPPAPRFARPPGSLRSTPAAEGSVDSSNLLGILVDMDLLSIHAYTDRRTLPQNPSGGTNAVCARELRNVPSDVATRGGAV